MKGIICWLFKSHIWRTVGVMNAQFSVGTTKLMQCDRCKIVATLENIP